MKTRRLINAQLDHASAGQTYDIHTFGGLCFEHGLKFARNTQLAREWYREGVRHGSGMSAYRLALLAQKQRAPWRSVAKLYGLAAARGVSDAYVNLGVLLERTNSKWRNKPSIFWYQAAHKLGNPLGTYNTARAFFHGLGVKPDKRKAKVLFRRALRLMTSQQGNEDFDEAICVCRRILCK